MGYYINQDSKGSPLTANGKSSQLVADGAIVQETPKYIPEKSVCVISNGIFDAAAYCYCQDEFDEFLNDHSGRPKVFLEYDHAKELAR